MEIRRCPSDDGAPDVVGRRCVFLDGPPGNLRADPASGRQGKGTMKAMNVLALSGSLRKLSHNTAMLNMSALTAPAEVEVQIYCGMGDLPLFNPDLESQLPREVVFLRDEIARADALLMASPEHARGLSGVMKNALDWMVETGVFVDKPGALWNASPRASMALAALRETLNVMSARLVDAASLELLILSTNLTEPPVNPNPVAMNRALKALAAVVLQQAKPPGSC